MNETKWFKVRPATSSQAAKAVEQDLSHFRMPEGVNVHCEAAESEHVVILHITTPPDTKYESPWYVGYRQIVVEALRPFLTPPVEKKCRKHFTHHTGVSLLPPPPNVRLIKLEIDDNDNQVVNETEVQAVALQARIDNRYDRPRVSDDDNRYPNAVDSEGVDGWRLDWPSVHYSFVIHDPEDGSLSEHDTCASPWSAYERYVVVDHPRSDKCKELVSKTMAELRVENAKALADEYLRQASVRDPDHQKMAA